VTFRGRFRTVYKFITGASHPGLNCFEPQTTVGVLTIPFSSQDIRRLESSKGHGKSLSLAVTAPFPRGSFSSGTRLDWLRKVRLRGEIDNVSPNPGCRLPLSAFPFRSQMFRSPQLTVSHKQCGRAHHPCEPSCGGGGKSNHPDPHFLHREQRHSS